MPRLFVVSVRDRAIDAFMNPFVAPAIGAAERSFRDEVNRPESPMYSHPEDYDLYLLGQFDSDKGVFDQGSGPTMLLVGKDVKKPLPPGDR